MDGDIRYENVSFHYEGGPDILKDVSFTMKAGTTLGILGGTGSGKSTLMLLLDKLYAPDSGRITIGGTDIRLIRTEELERFASSPCLAMLRDAETLYREQRFHVTLPAAALTKDELLGEKLKDERVLVQGVIDCVAVGRDGELTLMDYKTDRLTKAEREDPALAERVLRERHGAQLAYYADAALRIWGRRPRTYVYALHTGRLYPMD